MRLRIMLAAIVLVCGAAVVAVILRPGGGSTARPTVTVTPSADTSPGPQFPWTGSAFPSAAFSRAVDYCIQRPQSCFPDYSPSR